MPFFARNPSIPLWYLDEGPRSSPLAILLIPGMSCDLHDWSWQVPFLLSLSLRVISIDPRGQGASASPAPTHPADDRVRLPPGSWPGPEKSADASVIDYYPQSTALDLIALLESLQVTKVVVVSHSMGDGMGYFLATERPDLVAASVGLDPMHAFPNEIRDRDATFFDDAKAQLPVILDFFETFAYEGCPAWQKTWQLRRMRQSDEKVFYATTWGAWGDAQDSIGRRENAVRMFGGRLKCPRLTFGSGDWYVATDREFLPKGSEELDEIVLIEGKGHWFHQLESDVFNRHLERWLRKIGVLPV